MRTRLYMMAAAMLVLAGCGNDENEEMDNWNGEIRLSSGVTVQTRINNADVPDRQIAEGQKVGVHVADAAAGSGYLYDNVSVKAVGDGTFTDYSTTMYYPQGGGDVVISAYHPYKEETTDEYDFSVAEDQTDLADYCSSDLLYSTATEFSRNSTACNLSFKHLLSKITCTLTAGDGISSVEGAIIELVNVEKAVKFNRYRGTIDAATTSLKGDVKLGKHGAIIAPQGITENTNLLKITLGDNAGSGVFYYKAAAGTEFISGNLYRYNIKVNASGLTVTSSIEDWKVIGKTTNGTAEME